MRFLPFLLLFSTLAGITASVAAEEAFQAPGRYPLDRYEAGWQKNPFTLKAAAVTVAKESFAKNLALAGIYTIGDTTTVLVVDTQTRQYLRLKQGGGMVDGLRVQSVHAAENDRAATFVELTKDSESAVLRYDDGFLRQMAAKSMVASAGNATKENAVLQEGMKNGGGTPPVPEAPVPGGNAPAAMPPGAPVPAMQRPPAPPGMPLRRRILQPTPDSRRQQTLPQPRPAGPTRES